MIERTFIEQGMKKIQLEKYLKKQLNRAGFTGLNMVKTPLVTRIVLNVARPGLAIGKGGQNIRTLTEEIEKKFGIDNPQIEIQDIKTPALNARATVDKMAELIERGFNWKSVVFRTVRDINEAGAQGVELVMKGKLSGKGGRKRKHRVAHGYMKKVGDQVKLVDTAKASAYPKAGAIGITLSIIRPEVVFPDKVNIMEEIEKNKPVVEEEKPEGKEANAEKNGKEKGKEEEAVEGKAVKEEPKEKGKDGKTEEKETADKGKEEEKTKTGKEKPEAKKGKKDEAEKKKGKVKEEKKDKKEKPGHKAGKEKKHGKEKKETKKDETKSGKKEEHVKKPKAEAKKKKDGKEEKKNAEKK